LLRNRCHDNRQFSQSLPHIVAGKQLAQIWREEIMSLSPQADAALSGAQTCLSGPLHVPTVASSRYLIIQVVAPSILRLSAAWRCQLRERRPTPKAYSNWTRRIDVRGLDTRSSVVASSLPICVGQLLVVIAYTSVRPTGRS